MYVGVQGLGLVLDTGAHAQFVDYPLMSLPSCHNPKPPKPYTPENP